MWFITQLILTNSNWKLPKPTRRFWFFFQIWLFSTTFSKSGSDFFGKTFTTIFFSPFLQIFIKFTKWHQKDILKLTDLYEEPGCLNSFSNFHPSVLTLIGMRGNTFISLFFLDQILSAEFLSKISKLFLRWKLTSIGLIWHPAKLKVF